MWKTTLDGWKPINDGMFAIYQLVQDFATICSNMDLFRYFVGCIPPRIWDLNHLDPPENWGSNSVRGYCRMGTMSLGFGPEVSDKTIWTSSGWGRKPAFFDGLISARWWTRFEVGRRASRLDFSILTGAEVESHVHIRSCKIPPVWRPRIKKQIHYGQYSGSRVQQLRMP